MTKHGSSDLHHDKTSAHDGHAQGLPKASAELVKSKKANAGTKQGKSGSLTIGPHGHSGVFRGVHPANPAKIKHRRTLRFH